MFYNIRHGPLSIQISPEEKPYRFVEKLPAFSRKGHMLFRKRMHPFKEKVVCFFAKGRQLFLQSRAGI